MSLIFFFWFLVRGEVVLALVILSSNANTQTTPL
jgi:hypothetical protein